MKPLGVVGAIVGGLVGAVVWGLITWKTGYQIGYVAWGVGVATGALSYALGGRGLPNGVMCGVVSLVSMFAGRVMAIKWGLPEEVAKLPDAADLAPALATFSWGDAIDIAKSNFEVMDLVFAALGAISAFQLGGRMESEVPRYDPSQLAHQPPAPAPIQYPPAPTNPAVDDAVISPPTTIPPDEPRPQ